MCEVWKEGRVKELDSSLLNKLPKSLKNITLSGGEPFLYPDLLEAVKRIKFIFSNSRVVILTNGILTDLIAQQVRQIIKINPNIVIRLSIDGVGEIHDNIRGIKNAYANVINTLKILKELKIRDLGVMFTISDFNIEEIGKIYRMTKENRIKFTCQLIYNSSGLNYKENSNEIHQKNALKKELDLIISSEIKSFNLERIFKTYYYKGLLDLVDHLPIPYPCGAGRLFFYLNQEGDIYPCVFLDKKIGNIRNESFGTIWNNKLTYDIRQCVRKCSLNCWTIHTVAPAIRNNPFLAAKWVLINKLKAHLGRQFLYGQNFTEVSSGDKSF